MVYLCFDHDFGYGAYWMCFRRELPLEVDPRGVYPDDLGDAISEGFSLKEQAIMECEEDYKFRQEIG